MSGSTRDEREGRVVSSGTPYLSHSRINRYLLCPEQYRLYYIEGLRPRFPSANLVFGQAIHQALASLFQSGEDPVRVFCNTWEETRQVELTYSKRDSWEKLLDLGQALLAKFVKEELPKLDNVKASEKPFKIDITSLDLPLVGIIDLIATLNGKQTVVDFKTSGSRYDEHEVILSDQLTAYQLAAPEAEQTALCVLVKTKESKIQWHTTSRSSDQLAEYLGKAQLIGSEIEAGRFYKRPGKWCGWCDYLPVCLKNEQQVRDLLVRVA